MKYESHESGDQESGTSSGVQKVKNRQRKSDKQTSKQKKRAKLLKKFN